MLKYILKFGKKNKDDLRIYVGHSEGWKVKVKEDWSKECCYHKNENEDFFHSIVKGEIFFDNGVEKLCMNCAVKTHVVTDNRYHWQRETGEFVEEITIEEAEELRLPHED